MAREIKTNFTADTSDLERGARNAEQAIDGAESSSRNWGRAAGAAAVGVGAAAVVAWDFAQAAAEDEQAAAALSTTLRNVARATDSQVQQTEDWITQTQNATGVMDDALRPALDRLVRSTGDVGEAQDLLTLAMDISAGTGQDLESVADQLAAAEDGRVRGLRSLGIATTDAAGATLSFEEIVAGASETFGGQMAASTETMSGQLAIAQANFATIKEELGAKLLPILTDVAQFVVNDVIPAIEGMSAWVEEHWPEIAATTEDVWNRVVAAISGAWDLIGPIVLGIWDAVSGLVLLIGNIIEGDWGDAWDAAGRMVSGAWDAMRGVFGLIRDAVESLAQFVWDKLSQLPETIAGLFVDVGAAMIEGLGEGISAAGGLASSFAEDFANGVIGLINGVIGDLNGMLEFTIPGPGPIPDLHIDPPDLPRIPSLDSEGFINRDTFAFVHSGEVVADIDRVESWLGMSGGGRGGTRNITIPAAGYVAARDVYMALEELERDGMIKIALAAA